MPLGERDFRWLKLLLLDDKDIEKYLAGSPGMMSHLTTMREMVKESGREVVDIVADYLRLLWEHSLDEIAGTVGREQRDSTPLTVVVTVPAIWKDYSKSRMRLAVTKAGILDDRSVGPTLFHFASELEAAALARLTDLTQFGCIKVCCSIPVHLALGGHFAKL